MHHPTDRIAHTTAFVTPVVEHWLEQEIAQWVHPMKDQSDNPLHHERTLLPRSYISLPFLNNAHVRMTGERQKERERNRQRKGKTDSEMETEKGREAKKKGGKRDETV